MIDDAYNYLKLRHLSGNHSTISEPQHSANINQGCHPKHNGDNIDRLEGTPRLLVWSAADKAGIERVVTSYQTWAANDDRASSFSNDPEDTLANLCFTLDSHRTQFPWRSFAVLRSPLDLVNLPTYMSVPSQVQSHTPRLGFVFSGQGGQWFAMGRELLQYRSFRNDIHRAGGYLQSLGCSWSAVGKALPSSPSWTSVANIRTLSRRAL